MWACLWQELRDAFDRRKTMADEMPISAVLRANALRAGLFAQQRNFSAAGPLDEL